MKAISIRQPWAWLIIYGGKDIENRTWQSSFRGPVLIHASKGMTQAEWLDAVFFVRQFNPAKADRLLAAEPFDRGGIIGKVEIVNCMVKHPSQWFMGPYGFLLRNPEPLPFHPYKGSLGFFDVDYPNIEP